MFVRNRLFAAFSIAFFSGCAAVNFPEGGPRDEQKPNLTEVTPKNGTTNFNGKIITLVFDEDVRPKDLKKELIITPNTGNTYTTRNDRRTIVLEFDKPLEENTTYFLNFRQGIEDVTEGNKAQEITLSFSTGAFLDTGRVTGQVLDYLTQKPEDNFTIAMYPESDTSNIRDHKPYYFTRSNADGSFQLHNIKSGNYWIFAHDDKNANEFFDQEKEKIAYLQQPIAVQPKADSVLLKTVLLNTQKPYVLSTENFLDQNVLVFNEGIETLTFKTLENPPKETAQITTRSEDGKRINIYPQNGTLPERLIAISADSAGNIGTDTVRFSLSGKNAIPQQLRFIIDETEIAPNQQNSIRIKFPIPVQITGKNPFILLEDTINALKPEYPRDYQLSENKTELTLNFTSKAQKQVDLEIDTTQVSGINNKPFQKQKATFQVSRKATTGSISAIIKTNFTNYTVELLNEQGKIMEARKNPRTVQYEKLLPGNYQFRIKIDEDNDGKWEIGDKKLKTKPEKLYIYSKPISVRANWEIADIILTF